MTYSSNSGSKWRLVKLLAVKRWTTEPSNIPKSVTFEVSGPAAITRCNNLGKIWFEWIHRVPNFSLFGGGMVWEPQIFQIWSNLLFLAHRGQYDATMKYCAEEVHCRTLNFRWSVRERLVREIRSNCGFWSEQGRYDALNKMEEHTSQVQSCVCSVPPSGGVGRPVRSHAKIYWAHY